MPKSKVKLAIHLNLLKPQSNPEKLLVKLIRWLLSSGRYIFIVVNAVVLIAFGARFKLDADLAAKNDAIEEKIPYIEALRPYELLIRETQLKLSTISTAKKSSLDWPAVIEKIANQTPANVKIISINIKNDAGTATVNILGQTPLSNDLTNFINGLKTETTLSEVNLSSIQLDQGVIKFSVDASVKSTGSENKNL